MANLMTLFALNNLWMARQRMLNMAQGWVRPKPAEGPATGAKSALKRHEMR